MAGTAGVTPPPLSLHQNRPCLQGSVPLAALILNLQLGLRQKEQGVQNKFKRKTFLIFKIYLGHAKTKSIPLGLRGKNIPFWATFIEHDSQLSILSEFQ